MNIIFIAPPAAGKGTLANKLNEEYGFTHISAGDLLRNVEPSSSVYEEIQQVLKNGSLVKAEIITTLLKEKLSKKEDNIGFILDGFPRNLEQAHGLDLMLKELNLSIDKAIYLDVSIDTALKRILGRMSCPKCKRDYNLLTGYNTPKEGELCDVCHIPLEKRSDDNEESFRKRYNTYKLETEPVIEFLEEKNILIKLNGNNEIKDSFKQLQIVLGLGE